MIIFLKFEIKLYQKIDKAGVIKILITIPLTLETMPQLIINSWRRSPGPWCRNKEKNSKTFKKLETIAINFL